jgi:hypothetical protein
VDLPLGRRRGIIAVAVRTAESAATALLFSTPRSLSRRANANCASRQESMKTRDLNEMTYSREEEKIANYLTDMMGIGGGDDDPVKFLIGSHFELMRQRALLRVKYPDVFREIALDISDDMQCVEPMSRDLAERIRRLVNGVSADPDEPLGDESLL